MIKPDRFNGIQCGRTFGSYSGYSTNLYYKPKDDMAEQISARPDKIILGYPVISFQPSYGHAGSAKGLLGEKPDNILLKQLSNELQVTSDNPPAFIFILQMTLSFPLKIAYVCFCLPQSEGISSTACLSRRKSWCRFSLN